MANDGADAGHGVTEAEVAPHTDYPESPAESDVPTRAEHLREEAQTGKVIDAVDTLHSNGVDDSDRLAVFGRRMATLIYHGGLSPSEAKAKAAVDLFRSGRTLGDVANLLDMSRGGLSRLKGKAATSTTDARHLHYMQMFGPANLVFDFHIAAEPPADYETRYVLLELVNSRTEPEEVGGVKPNPRVKPPEPQYCLVTETHAPGASGIDLSRNPDERSYGPFQDMDVTWLADSDEVAAYLYEDEYFQSEERAETWRDHLATYGFPVKADPRERINPDVLNDDGL